MPEDIAEPTLYENESNVDIYIIIRQLLGYI
jgi:hypothetical protein